MDTVDRKVRITEGEGWKFFSTKEGKLRNFYESNLQGELIPRVRFLSSRWNADPTRRTIRAEKDRKPYKLGFHVYTNKAPALRDSLTYTQCCVRRVSFRGVLATGTSRCDTVIVAREIYIHPKGK